MKTIALEQVDKRIAETLNQQGSQEPILLTKGSDAIWLLLRLPEGTKDADVDGVFRVDGPVGRFLVIIEEMDANAGPLAEFVGCKPAAGLAREPVGHCLRLPGSEAVAHLR